jgi:hypothetical protein
MTCGITWQAGAMRPQETAAWCGHSALAPSAHGGRPPGGSPGTGPRKFLPSRSARRAAADGAHPPERHDPKAWQDHRRGRCASPVMTSGHPRR